MFLKNVAFLAAALTLICFLPLSAQNSPPPDQQVLDLSSMDKTVDPCVDFYTYSCGGWMKKNPVPPDQSSWSAYSKLQDETLLRLRGILEAATAGGSERTPVQQKIGDYYASCMDEKTVEAAGAAPLKPGLQEINNLSSKDELENVAVRM